MRRYLIALTILLIFAACLPAYAFNTTDVPTLGGSIERWDPRGQSSGTAGTSAAAVLRNPYMTYAPFVYIKGGVTFADFLNLPDFGQYAHIPGDRIAAYPPLITGLTFAGLPYREYEYKDTFLDYIEGFAYLGAPDIPYLYKSAIIDYFDASETQLKNYKTYIKTLGFNQVKTFASQRHISYTDRIKRELALDPEFKLDADGIFMNENDDGFYYLLIGKSIAYDRDMKLRECIEFRFYSLSPNISPVGGLGLNLGRLNDAELRADASLTLLFTPNAADDINDTAAAPAGGGFATPNAIKDLR